jgi:hypothetical protein
VVERPRAWASIGVRQTRAAIAIIVLTGIRFSILVFMIGRSYCSPPSTRLVRFGFQKRFGKSRNRSGGGALRVTINFF